MFKFKSHAVADATDDVCVFKNVIAVLVSIEDDSTAAGVAREHAARRSRNAICGKPVGRFADRNGSGKNDNENSGICATHQQTSV
ncbi:hypothetical protein [Rosistilla oblonga]|uniref:hypothetical protein n=1 Tax=Rosistilla oblonga TaxID=2527990 RepID=UPI003A97C405